MRHQTLTFIALTVLFCSCKSESEKKLEHAQHLFNDKKPENAIKLLENLINTTHEDEVKTKAIHLRSNEIWKLAKTAKKTGDTWKSNTWLLKLKASESTNKEQHKNLKQTATNQLLELLDTRKTTKEKLTLIHSIRVMWGDSEKIKKLQLTLEKIHQTEQLFDFKKQLHDTTLTKLDQINTWLKNPKPKHLDSVCIDPDELYKQVKKINSIPPRKRHQGTGVIIETPKALYNKAKETSYALEKTRLGLIKCLKNESIKNRIKSRQDYAAYVLSPNLVGIDGVSAIYTTGKNHDKLVIRRAYTTTFEWVDMFRAVAEKPGGLHDVAEALDFRWIAIQPPHNPPINITKLKPKHHNKSDIKELLETSKLDNAISLDSHNFMFISSQKDDSKKLMDALCGSKNYKDSSCIKCPDYSKPQTRKSRPSITNSYILGSDQDSNITIAVTIDGCESKTHHNTATVFLKQTVTSWKLESVNPGLNLKNCISTIPEWTSNNLICEYKNDSNPKQIFIISNESPPRFKSIFKEEDNSESCPTNLSIKKLIASNIETSDMVKLTYTHRNGVSPQPSINWCFARKQGFPLPEMKTTTYIYKHNTTQNQ